MYADHHQVGKTIRCPDCYVENLVQPALEAAPRAKRSVHKSYGVVDDNPPVTPVRQPAPAAKQSARQGERSKKQSFDCIFIACPQCGTRMHFAKKHAGLQAQCPDCETIFVIPQPRQDKRRGASVNLEQGQYDVGEITVDRRDVALPTPKAWTEPPPLESSKALAQRPRWTFFSGVVLFPWRGDVILYWTYLTGGILIMGLLLAFITGLYQQAASGSQFGGIAMAFPAIALTWATILTVSFGGACMWSILRDTAAGADVIEEWPSADWRVWIYPLLYLVYLASLAAVGGNAVQWVAHTPPGLLQAIAAMLLTPVLLLSTLETGHLLTVVSIPVLFSLLRSWRWWFLYYLLNTTLLAATAAAVISLIAIASLFLTAIAAAPTISATCLIAARLLGRLAWRIEKDAALANRRATVRGEKRRAGRADRKP